MKKKSVNFKQNLAVFSAATDSEHKISSNTTQERTKLLGQEPIVLKYRTPLFILN